MIKLIESHKVEMPEANVITYQKRENISSGTTNPGYKVFGLQAVPLESVSNLTIRWRHLHWLLCGATWIVTLPGLALLASSVSIELVSLSARVTSDRHLGPGIPGSDKNFYFS